jgi:hypothetical protein
MPSGGHVPADPEIRRIRAEIAGRVRSGRDTTDPEGTQALRAVLAEHRSRRFLSGQRDLTPDARRRIADELLAVLSPAARRAAVPASERDRGLQTPPAPADAGAAPPTTGSETAEKVAAVLSDGGRR